MLPVEPLLRYQGRHEEAAHVHQQGLVPSRSREDFETQYLIRVWLMSSDTRNSNQASGRGVDSSSRTSVGPDRFVAAVHVTCPGSRLYTMLPIGPNMTRFFIVGRPDKPTFATVEGGDERRKWMTVRERTLRSVAVANLARTANIDWGTPL